MKVFSAWTGMATTILFSLASITELHAAVSELSVDEGKITARYSDYPLRKGLKELAEQSGITFLIDPDVDGRLNFRMEKAPLTLGIRRLLSKYNHVIMQGKDEKGRLTPKLVRILRKGELTASNFDVIRAGSAVAAKAPSGGYRNYRQLLPKTMARPGRQVPSPMTSPSMRGRKLAQMRAKAVQIRNKISAIKSRKAAYLSTGAQQRIESGTKSLQTLSVPSIVEFSLSEESVKTSGASQRPDDEYYLQKELQETMKEVNDLMAVQAVAESPNQEVAEAATVAEQSKQSERLANTHRKPSGNSVKINLFPGQGDKVLD
ncbi:MAG: hypothetical protein HOD58_08970 [Gammaproteobacteria bacterium]|nr:hypothetical protein [Gammaproteobacteria bacterium]MBT4330041.1 hypothetical protein [Gammaproteobacteria bacterium]